MTTCLATKRKINDLIDNAPTKKARIKQMKQLAEKYTSNYEKCGINGINYFNNYYKKN